MIPKEYKNKKTKLTATITNEVDDLLDLEARETGNKSFIVEKALRNYYKLPLFTETKETEKLAS